ncbi:MAG TPA: hypothetical protein VGD21_12555, partial [Lysobacter sp.]
MQRVSAERGQLRLRDFGQPILQLRAAACVVHADDADLQRAVAGTQGAFGVGGGIGTYWGGVRSIGEKVKGAGQTSGIIPFIRVMDSLTLAISQGSLRRGSAAVYLDIHHPEIEEFLEIRKPSGDFNRKSLNLHHGINITDEFMEAVRDGQMFGLRSPKNNEVIREVDARSLWQKILEIRLQTGEPYLIFSDT